MSSFLVPFYINFGTFFVTFAPKLPKGSGARPKVVKSDEYRPQVSPSGAQGCPNGAQVGPRGTQMEPQALPKYKKTYPSHFKVPLGLQNVPQSVFEVKAASSGFELQAKSLPRPGARRRRRRSGRGLEGRAHQAARRRPRSGAEAGIRGHK